MGGLRRVRSVCVSLSAFSILSLILIARRHAVHRERDVVMANTSVRLSACPSYSGFVSKPMHISSIQTLSAFWYGNDTSLFERYRSYKIPTGTPSATALNTLRWDFFGDFRPKSPFTSETVRDRPMVIDYHRSLTGSHRYPIDPCHLR